MVAISGPGGGAEGVTMHPVDVNGRPGRLARDADGNPVGVLSLDVADGLIQAVRIIVNPDKLAHVGGTARTE
jgi:RNA polymerase sigma-70 factor (ECF subfamily)